MERDDILHHLATQPSTFRVTRHGRNSLRYYRLTVEDLTTILRACQSTSPTAKGRTNARCALDDGTLWMVTVLAEDGTLVAIRITDITPSHQRVPRRDR